MEPHVDVVLMKDSEYVSESIHIKKKSLKEIWTFKRRDLIIYFSAISIWAICLSIFSDFWYEVKNFWYFFPLGICGATVAMSTPAGGGIVFFPILTRFGVSTLEASAFTLATQTVGMGMGSLRWMLEDWKSFQWRIVLCVVPGGWIGLYLGLIHFHINIDHINRLIFSIVGLSLCFFTLYLYQKKGESDKKIILKPRDYSFLFIVGVVGGYISSCIGFGEDLYTFFIMVLIYKFTIRKSTVTSILLMASISAFGFFIHAHLLHTLRWEFWQMVIPGVLTGATIGPKILLSIGSKRMMYILTILLSLEFIATVFFRM
ncbi:sulfite exporter TauE/SafE family protein [bacterium]|nr:sulfite exporter TauE/SafE family protein [bacterium]